MARVGLVRDELEDDLLGVGRLPRLVAAAPELCGKRMQPLDHGSPVDAPASHPHAASIARSCAPNQSTRARSDSTRSTTSPRLLACRATSA
jgi:hypothetical protein